MYRIESIDIENDILVSTVAIIQKDTSELIVTVPVKFPKTKEEVIAAIKAREVLEMAKYDAAPPLSAIKAELEASHVGVEK